MSLAGHSILLNTSHCPLFAENTALTESTRPIAAPSLDCPAETHRDKLPANLEPYGAFAELKSELSVATGPKILYEFGPYRVDPDKQLLFRENQPVAITPKALETLLVLLRHNREVVSKDQLMKELWPDAFVEEANLSQNIFLLRKALGDSPDERRYIVTLPGRGYRFAAQMRTVAQDGGDLIIASRSRSELVLEQEASLSDSQSPALDARPRRGIHWKYAAAIAALAVLLAAGLSLFLRGRRPAALPLNEKDSVLIADFTNTTGDAVFDDALRQGLSVQLEQSPFLRLVSEDRVRRTLRLMGQPADARLTPAAARQVCERTGSAAVLEGSIASLGTQYVLGLRATDCRTGEVLDEEQVQAARKEDVLNALTLIASKFRVRVGESLASIHQHDTPLAEATTTSLQALQAYSMGWKLMLSASDTSALPFFQRAVQLDPQFAMAYASMGRAYGDLGEAALSAQTTAQAYKLRARASDPEKFWIAAAYDMQVTENLSRAQQTCQVWAQTYPRDPTPHAFLAGVIDPVFGQYQEAVQQAQSARKLDPDFSIVYFILASRYQALGRFDDAMKSFQMAGDRKLEIPDFLLGKYDLAFVRGDQAEMERIARLSRADPSADEWVANHQSSVLAYSGRLRDALSATRRAENLAQQGDRREAAALYLAASALWQGFYGNAKEAKRAATAVLALSDSRGAEYGAGLAFALAGDTERARQLADHLDRQFSEDISVQFSYLPTLRACLALHRRDPAMAIELLRKAAPYELGMPRTALHANFGALYPVYLRGLAFLAQRRGADAAGEFQKILDHPGIVVSDPIGALARLQIGRAYALEARSSRGADAAAARAKARAAYRDFLTLWKNADPGIPILLQAKAEYASLP